jgi:predicted PhzF superfamily epimerase YddE/YHI9
LTQEAIILDLSIFQVDAFAANVFAGNPAAICPLREWLDDAVLQSIAAENNLSERNADPDFEILKKLHPFSVCITAPGGQSDFVSRYFVPSYGVPEDPVTGSTHSSLVPYWSDRLNKEKFHARQLSRRGGDLWCELKGERVILKGKAVLYLTGSISI